MFSMLGDPVWVPPRPTFCMEDVAHMPNGFNLPFIGLSAALLLIGGVSYPVFLTVCASGVVPIVPLQEVPPHLVSKASANVHHLCKQLCTVLCTAYGPTALCLIMSNCTVGRGVQ